MSRLALWIGLFAPRWYFWKIRWILWRGAGEAWPPPGGGLLREYRHLASMSQTTKLFFGPRVELHNFSENIKKKIILLFFFHFFPTFWHYFNFSHFSPFSFNYFISFTQFSPFFILFFLNFFPIFSFFPFPFFLFPFFLFLHFSRYWGSFRWYFFCENFESRAKLEFNLTNNFDK